MLQSRIREIRRAKGLTLQAVADRIGTTAQTIGRLETGMRTLSIDWVERIANALETDPGELLSLPEGGDVGVTGAVGADGHVEARLALGTVALRLAAHHPLAIRMDINLGQYQVGDHIICDRLSDDKWDAAYGRDCLICLNDESCYFAKILEGSKAGTLTLVPIGTAGSVITDTDAQYLAPAVMLVRDLGR
jgi:DNA-binding XRE family transcriptional regulator